MRCLAYLMNNWEDNWQTWNSDLIPTYCNDLDFGPARLKIFYFGS